MKASNTGELINTKHILKDKFIHDNVKTGTDLSSERGKKDIIQTTLKVSVKST